MRRPTFREILLNLSVGQSHTFADKEIAASCAGSICKLYGINRKFVRKGDTITRVS